MHAGFDPGPALEAADLVLVVDGLTPWIPQRHALARGCRVIQLGPDPLFAATPVRGFPCDLALAGDVAASLELLGRALEPLLPEDAGRTSRLAAAHAAARAARLAEADRGGSPPMSPAFVSRRLSEALPADAILFSELGCDASVMGFAEPGSYFGFPPSGGLGWGLHACGLPMNKGDVSPAYVFFTSGLASLLFVALYTLIDIWGLRRWAWVFCVLGENALLAYFIQPVVRLLMGALGLYPLFARKAGWVGVERG